MSIIYYTYIYIYILLGSPWRTRCGPWPPAETGPPRWTGARRSRCRRRRPTCCCGSASWPSSRPSTTRGPNGVKVMKFNLAGDQWLDPSTFRVAFHLIITVELGCRCRCRPSTARCASSAAGPPPARGPIDDMDSSNINSYMNGTTSSTVNSNVNSDISSNIDSGIYIYIHI